MGDGVPTFSVIVLTFDRPGFLLEALNSVLCQTVQDFEIVVVDDGSTVPVRVPDDPRITLIRHPERRGPAAARNTGLASARGRYVCFLDDDDLYAPDRLEVTLRHLERVPLVVTWAGYLDSTGSTGRMLQESAEDSILDATTPHVGTVTGRREVIAGFDETYGACEDLEWWLRQARVCEMATAPRHAYLVRRHEGPRHGTGTEARIEHQLRLLEEHSPYFEQHPRARAFRWRRIGLMRLALGDRPGARAAFAASLAARPSARSAWHLARSFAPARRPRGTPAQEEGPAAGARRP